MQALWQMINHTPTWVLILFLYLIFIGFKATQPRTITLKKTIIAPAIFTIMSLHTLMTSFTLTPSTIATWIIAISTGSLLGWWYTSRFDIKVDPKQYLIQLPGTWSTLILIIIIFSSKYYLGYQLAVNPDQARQLSFAIPMLGLSGICTGLFIGRVSRYLQLMFVMNPQSIKY